MTTRFTGFADGSPVALSITRNGQTQAASVAGWRQPPGGGGSGAVTVSTVKRSNLQTAPEAIWFQASVAGANVAESLAGGTYDPSFHRVHYVWDFGDPGAASDKVVNLPAHHNDLNRGHGKFAAHVFSAPGTYSVTCTAWNQDDGTLIGSDSASVTVGDPATLFAGSRTICLSPAGNFGGKPSGAQQVTTWSAAVAALEALGSPGRILLRAGETIAITSYDVSSSNVSNFYLGTWGAGRAAVTGSQGIELVSNIDCTIAGGIDFDLGWNSRTESGGHNGGSQYALRVAAGVGSAGYALMTDCVVSGGGYALSVLGNSGNTATRLICIHNSRITNWGVYGIYAGGQKRAHLALIGCAFDQDEQAMMGGIGGFGGFVSNEEGPIRITHTGNVVIDACDLFSRTSWTQNGGTNTYPGVQPCIRLNTSPLDNWSRVVITRNSIEGQGISAVHATGGTRRAMNVLCEKNILVAYVNEKRMLETEYAAWTVRNNIFVKPNVRHYVSKFEQFMGFYKVSGHTDWSSAGNGGFKVEIYSNTAVNLLDPDNVGNGQFVFQTSSFSGTTATNNVHAVPNIGGQGQSGLNLTQAPLPVAGGVIDGNPVATWTPRWLGIKYNDYGGLNDPAPTTMDRDRATPPDTVKDFRPGAGSSAAADASGTLCAFDDFFGIIRPAAIPARARGYAEPA